MFLWSLIHYTASNWVSCTFMHDRVLAGSSPILPYSYTARLIRAALLRSLELLISCLHCRHFMVILKHHCPCTAYVTLESSGIKAPTVISLLPRSTDLCLTTYTISQDDLKSNHVITLEEPHYFESPAEVRLCLRSHYLTFLLPWTESGLLAARWVMEGELETEVI